MWHEARKQEKKLRGMLVNYRRRAERKRNYYNRIKSDPIQFMQLHGRPCKIFVDPAIAAAAGGPTSMMPWQGDRDNMIDRFDIRAHLDYIPAMHNNDGKVSDDDYDNEYDRRQVYYERYRIVAQNNYLGINEDKFLKQLYHEEQFGNLEKVASVDKKYRGTSTTAGSSGIAIGFNYDDPLTKIEPVTQVSFAENTDDSDSDSNIEPRELDIDMTIDASKLDNTQAHELNKSGCLFGMQSNDFYSFLINDIEEAENEKLAQEMEEEVKSMGRTRRERRIIRDRRLASKPYSPPSYAAKDSPKYTSELSHSKKSRSKSLSPEDQGSVTYITSFGCDDEQSESGPLPAPCSSSRRRSFSPKRGRKRLCKSRSRSRSRSSSRSHRRNRSRSKQNDRERSKNCHTRRRECLRSPDNYSKTTSSSGNASNGKAKLNVMAVNKPTDVPTKVDSPPLRRYYGRGRAKSSSSEFSISDDTEDSDVCSKTKTSLSTRTTISNTSTTFKGPVATNSSTKAQLPSTCGSTSLLKPQDKLKRKMKALLNRQLVADKIAEELRNKKAVEEQQNREDELREMSSRLKDRQRKLRHTNGECTSSCSEDNCHSRNRSKSRSSSSSSSSSSTKSSTEPSSNRKYRKHSKSRDRSRSRSRSRDRSRTRNRDRGRSRDRSREHGSRRDSNRSKGESVKKYRSRKSRSRSSSSTTVKLNSRKKSLVDY